MKALLERVQTVADHPIDAINQYVDQGKKAMGMVLPIGPMKLVEAAGMMPVGVWGDYGVTLDLSKQYFPAFAASVAMVTMEYALNGTYDKLSGMICPGLTDTLICLGQNLEAGVKAFPTLFLAYPQNRFLECGHEFMASELQKLQGRLETISGQKVTEESLAASIDLYNAHRIEMRTFSKLAAERPNTITNINRSNVYKSVWYMPRAEHLEIVKAINEKLRAMPKETYDGKKVVVTGLQFDDNNVLGFMEENHLRIVGDLVGHDSIQYNHDVPADKNGIERLARYWQKLEGFSVAYDPKKLRGKLVAKLAKERGATGAIFAVMKFSDDEEYDMPICMKDIKAGGIITVSFEFDQQESASEQIKTRIQTFAEIL